MYYDLFFFICQNSINFTWILCILFVRWMKAGGLYKIDCVCAPNGALAQLRAQQLDSQI